MPRTEEARMMNYKHYLVTVVFPLFHLLLNEIEIFFASFFAGFLTEMGYYGNYAHKLDLFTYTDMFHVFLYKKSFDKKIGLKNLKKNLKKMLKNSSASNA